MGATPFRHLEFAEHQPVTKEILDQYQSNIQWLVDNTPQTLWSSQTTPSKVDSLIILGGRQLIYLTYGKGTTAINFNGAFDSTAQPYITTGLLSEGYKHIWCTFNGIGTTVFPDSRGFEVTVQAQDTAVNYSSIIVCWMALGKRSANYDRL